MLKGLGSSILRALAAFLFTALIWAPGDASAVTIIGGGGGSSPYTELYLQSDPGDLIGGGQVSDITPTAATFTASGNATDFRISVVGSSNSFIWNLEMVAPAGQSFQVGQTYAANRIPAQPGSGAALSVSSEFQSCPSITGEFTIDALSLAPDGSVSGIAVDFAQHCQGATPVLFGLLRYNSSYALTGVYANAGPTQHTFPGLTVTLDASLSRTHPGGDVFYTWQQLVAPGDPVVTLTPLGDVGPPQATFIAPDAPPGGLTLTFQVFVSDLGSMGSDIVKVKVANENDPKTAFYYESDPGDPFGQGTHGFGAAPAISIGPEFGGRSNAAFGVDGPDVLPPGFDIWALSFGEAFAAQLQPGVYKATSTGLPNMMISSSPDSCLVADGLFVVRDIGYASNGQVANLGLDFIEHCDGASGDLHAALRYNSTTPMLVNHPTANAGPNLKLTQPGTVPLDGSDSFPGWGTITSYQWQQVHGPSVSLSNPNSAQASFALPPNMLVNGGSMLTFRFTVKNSLNLSDSALVTVTAVYPKTNLLLLLSDTGDPVGKGTGAIYTPTDAMIKTGVTGNNGVKATLNGDGNWTLDFAPPFKQKLQVGTYSNAGLYEPGTKNANPMLLVGTKPGQCKTVTGDFTVLDVAYGIGQQLSSLAVDFNQHCNGIGPALHGKLRYHSSLP